jgi:hypothetical protein
MPRYQNVRLVARISISRALFERGVMHPYFTVGSWGSLRGVKSEDWLSGLALIEYQGQVKLILSP